MMTSIRSQFNLLDAKISEFQQLAESTDNELDPIALEPIEFMDLIDNVVEEPETIQEAPAVVEEPLVEEPAVVEEPFVDEVAVDEIVAEEEITDEPVCEPEPEAEVESEPEAIFETESVVEPLEPEVVEEEVEVEDVFAPETVEVTIDEEIEEKEADDDDDLPFFDEPEVVFETVLEAPAAPVAPAQEAVNEPVAIIDAMTDRQAWRTDIPGGAVRDVRSAISLNDRILFINKLFDEDPLAFQNAIARINSMATLAEVVEYIATEHSDWNLESDTVYRFMMAVRRKVR